MPPLNIIHETDVSNSILCSSSGKMVTVSNLFIICASSGENGRVYLIPFEVSRPHPLFSFAWPIVYIVKEYSNIALHSVKEYGDQKVSQCR